MIKKNWMKWEWQDLKDRVWTIEFAERKVFDDMKCIGIDKAVRGIDKTN